MSILEFIWWAIIFYLFIYMPISHVMNNKAKRKEKKGEKKYILVEESEYDMLVGNSFYDKKISMAGEDLSKAQSGHMNGYTSVVHSNNPFKIGI